MIYRFSEYHGIALRRYGKKIVHIVLYLGDDKAPFQTALPAEQVFQEITVIRMNDMDTDDLLSSQIPAEIINAILSDYAGERIEFVLRSILSRLQLVCKSQSEREKYLKQLLLLSCLRRAETITIKIYNEMSLLIDVEKDTLYLQGLEKGLENM